MQDARPFRVLPRPARRVSASTFSLLTTMVFATLLSCRADTAGLLSARLKDGRTVASVTGTAGKPTVVLVYAPSDCFGCGPAWPEWRQMIENRAIEVKVFLTSEPDSADKRALIFQRVQVDGILERPLRSPSEYLIVNDSIIARAESRAQGAAGPTSPILQEARALAVRRSTGSETPPP